MSKAATIASRKYRDKSYDQINVIVPKGRKKDIAEYAASNGKTLNGLISQLLQEKIGISANEWNRKQTT